MLSIIWARPDLYHDGNPAWRPAPNSPPAALKACAVSYKSKFVTTGNPEHFTGSEFSKTTTSGTMTISALIAATTGTQLRNTSKMDYQFVWKYAVDGGPSITKTVYIYSGSGCILIDHINNQPVIDTSFTNATPIKPLN